MTRGFKRGFQAHKLGHKKLGAYRAPKVESRPTKQRLPKTLISLYLYLRYKFRSSTVTDKKIKCQLEHNVCAYLCLRRFRKYIY